MGLRHKGLLYRFLLSPFRSEKEETAHSQPTTRTGHGLSELDPELTALMINGRACSLEEAGHEVGAMLAPDMLKRTGGMLFKAGLACDPALKRTTAECTASEKTAFDRKAAGDGRSYAGVFEFGAVPNFHGGERGYHYQIPVSVEEKFVLTGSLTPQRELTILFRNAAVSEADRAVYRRSYRLLARLLLKGCGEVTLGLDWITVKLMEEQGLYDQIPETLEALAAGQEERQGG